MKAILFILLFTISTFGATARMSDYATPNDNLDDSAGIQDAIDALAAAGGGTLIFTEGTWDINSSISFITTTNVNNSFTLRGSKGTIIRPHVGSTNTVFVAGNQNQLSFEDMVFVGDQTANADFSQFLYASYVAQIRLTGCQFFGLRASDSVLQLNSGDTVIRDTAFYGLSSTVAVVRGQDIHGLTVKDTEFLDYGWLNNTYYSKTATGNAAWINVSGDNNSLNNANGQRPVILENVRFDEGGYKHVIASHVTFLQAVGITANIAAVDEGTAFYLSNVKYAEIKMSKFGYATSAKPAVTAVNNSTVYMDSASVGDSVYYGLRDSGSQAFFNLKACSSGCTFSVM